MCRRDNANTPELGREWTVFSEVVGLALEELAAAEHLPGIPVDPDGHTYGLSADGRVLVEHPDDFPFITKGLPPGYKPPGPKAES